MMNDPGYERVRRIVFTGLISAIVLAIVGCGSTTKVYEARKTIVYNEHMYNVTDTRQFSANAEGRLPDGQVVNLAGIEKKSFQKLLDANKSVDVRMFFHLDELELPYRNAVVKSWRDLQSMQDEFARAGREITKLMKEEKSTQIRLK